MRLGCECRDSYHTANGSEAIACSFECTFFADCATRVLGGTYPNCGGGFVAGPTRAMALPARFPPLTERTLKAGGCPAAA